MGPARGGKFRGFKRALSAATAGCQVRRVRSTPGADVPIVRPVRCDPAATHPGMTSSLRFSKHGVALSAAIVGLAAAAVLTSAVSYLVDEDSRVWWGNASWELAALVAVLGVAAARRRSPGDEQTAWTLLLVACVAWLVGQLIWWRYSVTAFPASPNPADLLWLAFAGLSAAAVLRFGGNPDGARVTRWLETIPLVIAVVALMTALMWDNIEQSTLPGIVEETALAYPIFYVAAALLMIQAVVSGAIELRGNAGAAAVVGGLVIEALAFILWTPQLLDESYVVGTHAIDVLWTAGLLLLGLGAWRAGPMRGSADLERVRRRRGGILPSMIFAALTLFQIVYILEDQRSGAELVLAIGVALVGGTLIARASLVRRQEAEMHARLQGRERDLAEANVALVHESRQRQTAHKELEGILDSAARGSTAWTARGARRSSTPRPPASRGMTSTASSVGRCTKSSTTPAPTARCTRPGSARSSRR